MIKVMKFGGTSVGSRAALERAAFIIGRGRENKAVVVSAMSGVTNSLIACIREKQELEVLLQQLKMKYTTESSNLMSEEIFNSYSKDLDGSILRLGQVIRRRWAVKADPILDDTISSWGERLSTLCLASILRSRGLDSIAVSSEEAGIVAMGLPGNGSADLEATHENLQMRMVPLLEQGKLPIITGYYGCDLNGRPLTFGRGGSDYSASVVAYGLDADYCEIWTDVNGFMTADPRAVPEAATIKEMDYGEAAELAYFGAKVLHPRTIEPVRRKGICLLVKNTFDPEGSGTRIRKLKDASGEVLRSVAMKSDLSIIKVYSSEIVYQPELVSRLLSAVSDGVSTYAVSTSLSTLAVVIPTPSVKGMSDKIAALGNDQIEKISVKDNVSLICAVGDNMINIPGVAAKVFVAVEEAGANIELISEGASDVALNFVVPSNKALDVVRKIHRTFIGGSS